MYGFNDIIELFDFGEGCGWDGYVSGGSIKFDLGNDWQLVDCFNFIKGEVNIFGFVLNGFVIIVVNVVDNGELVIGVVIGIVYDGDMFIQ